MTRPALRRFGLLALVGGAVAYGMLAVRYKLPPSQLLRHLPSEVPRSDERAALSTQDANSPADLISMESPEDAAALKQRLANFLWGAAGVPTRVVDGVDEGLRDARFEDIAELASIDLLMIEMDFGLDSRVYRFHPRNPGGAIVLYHQGHRGDFVEGKEAIRALLGRGYTVFAFSMPLLGSNSQPLVSVPKLGTLRLSKHGYMKFLVPESGHPIKYFVEPVLVLLNELESQGSEAPVAMMGISGGGWTTILAAALDDRISLSFPVAGALPLYLRAHTKGDWGDYEQTVPELYRIANYLELFVLGSLGPGRLQLQVFNEFDSCCFRGSASTHYAAAVQERIESIGPGEFVTWIDDSHREHAISDAALRRILEELGGRAGRVSP